MNTAKLGEKTRMREVDLDPAEEWLAQNWIGNLYLLLNREEIVRKIKIRLYKYIYELLEKTKQNDPPYQPDLLFEERKILEKIEAQLPHSKLGILLPTFGGFIMKIKSDEGVYRKRFSTAHEIGHTFFYDIEQAIPIIRFRKSYSRYWVVEDYANEIAASILLPESSLKKEISDKGLAPSLEALRDLSGLYEVSYDVLCRRIVRRLGIWDCVVFKSKMDSDGTIRTDSASICKGPSHTKWVIPKILKEDLYSAVAPVFVRRIFSEDLVTNNIKFTAYSRLMKDDDIKLTSISIIVAKET